MKHSWSFFFSYPEVAGRGSGGGPEIQAGCFNTALHTVAPIDTGELQDRQMSQDPVAAHSFHKTTMCMKKTSVSDLGVSDFWNEMGLKAYR